MVSEWMKHGNLNQFVTTHPHANRFELVSYPFKLSVSSATVANHITSAVGRCSEGFGPYARSGNDPR